MGKLNNFFTLSAPFSEESFRENLEIYYEGVFTVVGYTMDCGHCLVTMRMRDPVELDLECKSDKYRHMCIFKRAKSIYGGEEFVTEFYIYDRSDRNDQPDMQAGDTVYMSEAAVMDMIIHDSYHNEIDLRGMDSGYYRFEKFPSDDMIFVAKPDGHFGMFQIKLTNGIEEIIEEIMG